LLNKIKQLEELEIQIKDIYKKRENLYMEIFDLEQTLTELEEAADQLDIEINDD